MKKHNAILAILFTAIISLNAQTDFKQGFIVQNSGDTIHGLIKYGQGSIDSHQIKFKNEITAQEQAYTPMSIKCFQVNNEQYISKTVSYIENPSSEEAKNSLEPKLKQDTAFLTVLVKGRMNLLYLKDNYKDEHFFIANDTLFEELMSRSVYKYQNGVEREIKIKKYIGQLNVYLRKDNDTGQSYDDVRYNYSDLIRVFSTYNYNFQTPVNQVYISDIIRKKAKINLNIIMGINMASLSMDNHSGPYDYLTQNKFNLSMSPEIGIGVDINFPLNNYHWSYSAEVSWSPSKFNNNYTDDRGYYYKNITTSEFDISYLKISNIIKYHFSLGKIIQPYILGGFAFENLAKSASKASNVVTIATSTSSNSWIPMSGSDYRSYGLGLIGGIGFNYKKYFFEYRFNRNDDFSNLMNLGARVSSHLLSVGYHFDVSKK